jgi:hypothetical protein
VEADHVASAALQGGAAGPVTAQPASVACQSEDDWDAKQQKQAKDRKEGEADMAAAKGARNAEHREKSPAEKRRARVEDIRQMEVRCPNLIESLDWILDKLDVIEDASDWPTEKDRREWREAWTKALVDDAEDLIDDLAGPKRKYYFDHRDKTCCEPQYMAADKLILSLEKRWPKAAESVRLRLHAALLIAAAEARGNTKYC